MCNFTDEFGRSDRQQTEVRICRTIDCGLLALDGDVFCAKCSEYIESAREAARRRFVTFGTRGRGRLRKE